jgi:exopolysaccharide production protein ExoQ
VGSISIILFCLFCLFGFSADARERKGVTSATWLPLLWMVICASRSVGQWLNLSSPVSVATSSAMPTGAGGSLADQVVLGASIILGIIILFKRREATTAVLKNNKALLVFTFYLGLTVSWSAIPEASFRSWVRLTGNLIMAGVLATEPQPAESIRSVFRRTAYLLVPLSVVLVKYFPQMGTFYSHLGGQIWAGAALMKNGLGHLALVASFFVVWDMISTWKARGGMKSATIWLDLAVLVMSLWLLRGSSSSAALGCLIAGTGMLIIFNMPIMRKNFKKIGALVILAVCVFLALESLFEIIELTVSALGRDMTFTDRVPLWQQLIAMGNEKIFLGYGYEGFWLGGRRTIEGLSQAHNGYLEIYIEGGIVALILLGTLLVSCFKKIGRGESNDLEYSIFRFSLLVIILMANVTESALARQRDLLSFVFYIVAMIDPAPARNDQLLVQSFTESRWGSSQT